MSGEVELPRKTYEKKYVRYRIDMVGGDEDVKVESLKRIMTDEERNTSPFIIIR
jgi:hypothetical protein